ncbi:alpha/beta hydrolase [Actinomadura roseirufa]|uniref:alpha/beta hydrolase n=1 Tax=Actinomadura roseirufa TaxID=2094049 RepID=UPI001F5F3AA7|nr:alpha/beta hydrolase [Actinomadura roseirufa]
METIDLNDWPGRELSDEDLDLAYNVRRKAGPELFERHMARYRAESERAVAGLPGHPGLVYDEASGERLDVWGVEEGRPRPAFVFLHGGYWAALSRADSAFMARTLHEQGVATVVPDYTLAPAATLEEIVRQVRAVVAWVHRHGRAHGLDPDRIVVGGSSAGGHLTGMTMVGGWQEPLGLPGDVVKAAMPFSGLFDIRPLTRVYVNRWVRLDVPRAAALSPALLPAPRRCPAVVAVAEHDGAGFLTQTRLFRAHWGAGEPMIVPDRDHFDVVLDLADADSAVCRALLGLIHAI